MPRFSVAHHIESMRRATTTQGDIALLKTYGLGPYSTAIKKVEDDIKSLQVRALAA